MMRSISIFLLLLFICIPLTDSLLNLEPCNKFFNSENAQLHVPPNQSCAIQKPDFSFLHQNLNINIEGTLYIQDYFSLHLKIARLQIGEKGLFSIGYGTPILKNLIVIEQIGQCITENNLQGRIEIFSMPYQVYQLYDSAFQYEENIQLIKSPSSIIPKDYIYIIGSHENYKQEKVKVKSIFNSQITTQNPLQQDYIKFQESLSHSKDAFVFQAPRQFQGVQMINMCIKVQSDMIVGAVFINPQKLTFIRGSVQNCLFTQNETGENSQESQDSIGPVSVRLISTTRDNIFFAMNNINITLSILHEENYFINISQLRLNSDNTLINSSIYFCDVTFIFGLREENSFLLQKISSYNSQFELQDQFLEKNLSIKNSLLYHMNALDVSQLSSFDVENSIIILSNFLSSNNQQNQNISFFNSVFLGEQKTENLLTFCNKNDQKQISLDLKSNQFMGFSGPVFSICSNQERYFEYFAMKNSDILYNITWYNNEYGQNQHIFDLNRMKISTLKGSQLVYIFHIQNDTNQNTPFKNFNVPFFSKNISLQLIESESLPSYYLIKKTELNSKEELKSDQILYSQFYGFEFIGSFFSQVSKCTFNYQIQILSKQSHVIDLSSIYTYTNDNIIKYDFINSRRYEFILQFQEVSSHLQKHYKKIIFTSIKTAISKVIIKEMSSSLYIELENSVYYAYLYKEGIFYTQIQHISESEIDSGIQIFYYERQQNILSITWVTLPPEGISFQVTIESCNLGEILDPTLNECTSKIPNEPFVSLHPQFFNKKCSDGFAMDKGNRQNCNKCKLLWCKSCSEELDICNSCFQGYILHQNKCLEQCPNGTYYKSERCFPCIVGCANCDKSQQISCENCYQPNSDDQCRSCEKYQTLENRKCIECSQPNCQSCNGVGLYNCKECKEGYEIINGICQNIKIHLQCTLGQVKQNGNCLNCSEECLSCTEVQGKYCSQCSPSAFQMISSESLGNITCIKCQHGQYGEGLNCKECDESCNNGCFGPLREQCYE